MTKAACVKKAACNPPVVAAVETADRMTAILDREAERGTIDEAAAEALIYEFAASDERYVEEQKAIQGKVYALIDSIPARAARAGRPFD